MSHYHYWEGVDESGRSLIACRKDTASFDATRAINEVDCMKCLKVLETRGKLAIARLKELDELDNELGDCDECGGGAAGHSTGCKKASEG